MNKLLIAAAVAFFVANSALAQVCIPQRDSHGKIARSKTALAEFKRQNPCPNPQARRGTCAGWVIDHVVPLCACGADTPSNMQWQTRTESLRKDKQEAALCAKLKKGK